VLSWTRAGAVETPTTLQIRVTRNFPGRVEAGAPEPSRNLSDDEVRDNVDHFTRRRRGPRTTPCDALVLSGVHLDERAGLAPILDDARGLGVRRVVLHLGRGDRDRLLRSPIGRRVDAVAVVTRDETDLADVAALRAGPDVTAVVLLDEHGLSRLDNLATGLARVRPHRVVFTWPFPPAAPPPHAARVATALPTALAALDAAAVPCHVKGLPACALGAVGPERLVRSGNRWYVDAAHQKDAALLFFPDVVRFAKADVCRFCGWGDRCDGAPSAWLDRALTGRFRPFPLDAGSG
jgi:hypothetical protein